jgi:hypothetical protein
LYHRDRSVHAFKAAKTLPRLGTFTPTSNRS